MECYLNNELIEIDNAIINDAQIIYVLVLDDNTNNPIIQTKKIEFMITGLKANDATYYRFVDNDFNVIQNFIDRNPIIVSNKQKLIALPINE